MAASLTTISIHLEIPIKAKIEHVWKSLVDETGLWWRKDFYTSPKTKNFIIEAKVGGRMYEDYGNNEGLLWANVLILDSPNVLELKGHLTPEFGGPAMSFLRLTLNESDGITILTIAETMFGAVSEKTKQDQTDGWKLLFEETFKGYVEGS